VTGNYFGGNRGFADVPPTRAGSEAPGIEIGEADASETALGVVTQDNSTRTPG
jgi:hypothetical protein